MYRHYRHHHQFYNNLYPTEVTAILDILYILLIKIGLFIRRTFPFLFFVNSAFPQHGVIHKTSEVMDCIGNMGFAGIAEYAKGRDHILMNLNT